MSFELHINKPSEAAVNTAGALNSLLKSIARLADAGDDRALKYVEAYMALVFTSGEPSVTLASEAVAGEDSSVTSTRVPEKPSRDTTDKIVELEQLVAQLTDEQRAAVERHVADEAMLRDALGKERNKSHALEMRIAEKDAQIDRLTRELAQGRDDSWQQCYESARRDIDAIKRAHTELQKLYDDLLDIRRRLGAELSTRTDERDALRAQVDSTTRRLEQQNATISQLQSDLELSRTRHLEAVSHGRLVESRLADAERVGQERDARHRAEADEFRADKNARHAAMAEIYEILKASGWQPDGPSLNDTVDAVRLVVASRRDFRTALE